MIRSMTAFARQEAQFSWGQVCWELRSVNHRYLDISMRLPEEFRRLEIVVRERLQGSLKRGKIDSILYVQPNKKTPLAVTHLNLELVQQVWGAIQAIQAVTGPMTPPTALEILRWPGVIETSVMDLEQVTAEILQQFDLTLAQLVAHREREGAQLTALLEQRGVAIAAEVLQVRSELPTILQAQRDKLQARLTELSEQLDNERVEQEIVMLAHKMDVSEELDRLEAHLSEMRQTWWQEQPTGRRLDFLIQELYREANTLGAKSYHLQTTRHSVELKVLIEQMREQVQNIE